MESRLNVTNQKENLLCPEFLKRMIFAGFIPNS